jgi:hypothetical protein
MTDKNTRKAGSSRKAPRERTGLFTSRSCLPERQIARLPFPLPGVRPSGYYGHLE